MTIEVVDCYKNTLSNKKGTELLVTQFLSRVNNKRKVRKANANWEHVGFSFDAY